MKNTPSEAQQEAASRTQRAQQKIARFVTVAHAMTHDTEQAERRKSGLCIACYYTRDTRMGGAAIRQRDCEHCEQPQTYGSTATDCLCLPCATTLSLCKQCGGDNHTPDTSR